MLRPGGVVAFCGEPSRYGDRLSSVPKRGALARGAAVARRCVGRRAPRNGNGGAPAAEEDRLEQVVDVHAFTPGDLSRYASAAGFADVRVSGEELAASLFGWANRTLEATAEPSEVPWAWRVYAYRGYLLLQRLDRSLLEPRLPAALFYNLLVSARAPAPAGPQRYRSAVERPGAQLERAPARAGACGRLASRTTQPQHGVHERHARLGTPRSCRFERPGRRRQPALRGDLVEHQGRPRAARAAGAAGPARAARPPSARRRRRRRAARWR